MMVPETNLLLYATDSTSPFHDVAREWWTSCLNGSVPVGLCHPVVFAFVRISTNRRAFEHPLSLGQVTGIVQSWSDRKVTRMLYPGPGTLAMCWNCWPSPGRMAVIWSPTRRLPSSRSRIGPKCIPRTMIFGGFAV